MKTIASGVSSETTGALSSRKLTIATNAKMFKELISGIYSDKAYAIARETFANCVDSHVAFNTPERQFEVHIPTVFEPWYSVRDFGTSMTHETVEELYSTLGLSSKDDPNSEESNKYVGKFGLGSKSPFAYTDSFQVTAFLEGRARIYDIFFNAGEPETALLSDEPSDEEQGILVSFGVDPKDIADFVRAIKRAAEGLDVLPKFLGDIELHKRTILDEGNGWRLQDRTQSGKAEARQGTVLYPLNFQAVIDCPRELAPLFDRPFRFDFPIGSLDIVTSREALSYDESTSKNIIERLKAVQADIMQKIADAISGAETYWEFCRAFKKVSDTYPENLFGKLMTEKPKFKGREPKQYIDVKTSGVRIPEVRDPVTKEVTKPMEFKFRFGHLTYCKLPSEDWNKVVTFREDKDRRSNSLTLNTQQKLIVVTEDMRAKNRYPAARIRKLLDSLINQGKRNNAVVLWVRHQGDSQYVFNRMFAAFGRPKMEVIDLLSITHDVPKAEYATGPRMPFKKLDCYGSWITPEAGSVAPGEAYFVPLRNGDVDFSGEPQFSSSFMAELLPCMVALGADDKPIIGIPASSRKIIEANPQWTPFYDYVVDNVDAMFDEVAYTRRRTHITHTTKHDLVAVLTKIEEHTAEEDKGLLHDAFSGTDFDKLKSIFEYDIDETDAYQDKIVEAITRIEDRRVSAATAVNSTKINEARDAWVADPANIDIPFDASKVTGLDDVVNRGHVLRDAAKAKVAEWNDDAIAQCEKAAAEFPLLSAVQFKYYADVGVNEALARELLNYVFNKRLLAVDEPEVVVDTAVAA